MSSFRLRASALACVVSFMAASSATAQDEAIPEADPIPDAQPFDEPSGPGGPTGRDSVAPGQTPADETPIGEARRTNPGPGFGADRTHARLRWEQYRIPFEIDQARSLGLGSRQLNRRTDWLLEKTSMRFEVGRGFGSEDLQIDLYGGLGWGWTEMSLDARRGADINPAGPHFVADFDSDADFDVSLGTDVWAFVTDTVFVGVGYQFLFSHVMFEDELIPLIGPSDGEANLTIHDLTVRVGTRINRVASVWVGSGITAVWGEVDFDVKGGGDGEFELENESWVKGVVGAAFHPGDNVVAKFEAQFMPEPTFRMDIGWSF